MSKALQKTLMKLGITGCLALITFDYPLLSLYTGHIWSWPTLYVLLFGIWAGIILVAFLVADSDSLSNKRSKSEGGLR